MAAETINMQTFACHQPTTLADHDATCLAGGQTLLQSMKLGLIAPSAVVDLGGIAKLKGICLDAGSVVIGAGSTHAAVAGAGAGGVFRVAALEARLAANWSAAALAGTTVPADDLNSDLQRACWR